MTVYPASRNRQRCIDAVAALEAAGHKVTHNWAIGPACRYSSADAEIAATDVIGVRTAQVLLLLWEPGMLGANVEFGIALGLNKRIIVVGWFNSHAPEGAQSGTQGDRNVFYHLPQVVHANTLDDALNVLEIWRAQEK